MELEMKLEQKCEHFVIWEDVPIVLQIRINILTRMTHSVSIYTLLQNSNNMMYGNMRTPQYMEVKVSIEKYRIQFGGEEMGEFNKTPEYTEEDVIADRKKHIARVVLNHSIAPDQDALNVILRACENYNQLLGDTMLDE